MKQLDDVDKDMVIGAALGFAVAVVLTVIHLVVN